MAVLNFAGTNEPSFIKVNSIQFDVLPEVETNTQSVLGRVGSYDFGSTLGTKIIKAKVQIIGDTNNDVMSKGHELAEWLFHEDQQVLKLPLDEPNRYYYARVSNKVSISELLRIGEGTIEFLLTDPHAYSDTLTEIQVTPTAGQLIQLENNGNTETFPEIELDMTGQASALTVAGSDGYVTLGDDNADNEKVDVDPLILHDDFSSFSGWTTASAGVDKGVINNSSFTSNGYSISVSDYGDGSGWKGAGAVKSLPQPLTNFTAQAKIGLRSQDIEELGVVAMYLLDSNDRVIGKIAMKDFSRNGDYPFAEARAGEVAGGEYLVESYGDYKGVFSGFGEEESGGGYGGHGGFIRIGRHGNRWFAYFAKINDDGKHHTRLPAEWIDENNSFPEDLAKIQIYIGKHGDEKPVNSMYFADLKVFQKTMDVDESTKDPINFKSGDKVLIDTKDATVYKNGEIVYDIMDIGSDFFSLKKGSNGLLVMPSVADATIRFRERWL